MATTTTKPRLDTLQTPVSATYPSELRSPMAGTPTFVKREEGLKTPITPPAAYLDFLKTLSPVLMSPATTGTRSSFGEHFAIPNPPTSAPITGSFDPALTDASAETKVDKLEAREDAASTDSTTATSTAASSSVEPATTTFSKPTERPSRANSITSVTSTASNSTESISSEHTTRPNMKIVIPPPPPQSPFVRPHSARTPRGRLSNPMSPFSPSSMRSPLSATAARTPVSAHSALYSPYSTAGSPRGEWEVDKRDNKGSMRQVSVRQVVTRTVMYTRTPVVDPVPPSKKRKTEHDTS